MFPLPVFFGGFNPQFLKIFLCPFSNFSCHFILPPSFPFPKDSSLIVLSSDHHLPSSSPPNTGSTVPTRSHHLNKMSF